VLWVVGRGDDARFGRLAERLGIRDAIRFLGQRADVESLYEGADIFVLPTLYETFCIAAYEAAASGLPIVSTRVSGVVDLVGEDVAGILVERTAESVGEALGRLTFDAELRAGLGREGRQRAASYRWQDSVDATLGVYHRLLSSSPVGRKAMLARSVAEVGKA
jgi:glycosyltransferase involved in cell wall biosynthesis